MTQPANKSRESAEYLRKVLRMNPLVQPREILAARDQYLGISTVTADDDEYARLELRQQMQQKIEQLRLRFWQLPPAELKAAFNELDVNEFPELRLAMEQLYEAARVRKVFPKLLEESWCDNELFQRIRQTVVAAPGESGRMKQAFVLRLTTNDDLRKSCRRMVRKLRSDYPELYELDAEWFELIAGAKRRAKAATSSNEQDQADDGDGHWGWWMLLVVIVGLLRVGVRALRD